MAQNGLRSPSSWFGQFAGNGHTLRVFDRGSGAGKECPEWADWRREAHSPQTFFSLGCAQALRKLTAECALSLTALSPPAQPAAPADLSEDDAARGPLVAQPETPASLSRLAVRRHDPRQEPGAVVPLAGICAGGGEQSPSLPRHVTFQKLSITFHPMD
jgi:hypothetical protein